MTVRNYKVIVRFSQEEIEKLKRNVLKSGLSISGYIRLIILNAKAEIITESPTY